MGTLLPKILTGVCTSSVYTEYVDQNGKKMVLRDIGFSLTVPPGVIPYRQSVKFAVCLSFSGPFVLPDGCELVSPVYFISAEPEIQLKKQIELSLDHWMSEAVKAGHSYLHHQILFRASSERGLQQLLCHH